jgi:hypothetical protein
MLLGVQRHRRSARAVAQMAELVQQGTLLVEYQQQRQQHQA